MQRNSLAAAGFAVLLFLSGAAAGALGHRYYVSHMAPAPTEAARHRYLDEMHDRLKLTPAQMTQLEQILRDTKAKAHAVHDSYQPQMQKIRQDHIEHVKAILTPEQIPLYDKLNAERDQRSHNPNDHQ